MRAPIVITLATCFMVACGGGGGEPPKAVSGSTSQTGADAQHGALTLGLTGGAYPGVAHVWITVASVALHTDAARAWSPDDRSWTVLRLSSPVVVDLAVVATSSTSDVTRVLTGLSVPQGRYAQIRLFPLAHDAALQPVAQAAGLRYNAQVDVRDASTGALRSTPLELAQPELGWRLSGSFDIAANTASYLVLQADIASQLVPLGTQGGVGRYSFSPRLRAYDMSASGALIGLIDSAGLCGGAGARAAPDCADEVQVTAQQLSADGQRYEPVRRFKVSATGGFALYPLPASERFDLVITGQRMRTMVVRGVTAAPFDAQNLIDWTIVGSSSAGITLVIEGDEARTVNLASAVSPAAGSLFVGQTVLPAGVPHEIAGVARNPLTGLLAASLPLPEGPLMVADFAASDTPLSFTPVTPAEGPQAFMFQAGGTVYDAWGAISTATPPLGDSSVITVNAPSRLSGVASGTLRVQLTGALSAAYDAVDVVVADVHGIVATQRWTGGAVTFTLPAGPQAAAQEGGAIYAVSLRATGPSESALQWRRAAAVSDLRSAGASAEATLALP
ncbi:MAG: DUF4382 domain-containing protein [Aquabacterium sp.]